MRSTGSQHENKGFSAMRTSLAVALIAATLAGTTLAGPPEDASAAYERGDYATALRIRLELAEQGDLAAQVFVGLMYARGHGVSRDDTQAVQWYRRAAEQDYAWGQTNLGYMHETGRGVAKDEAEAAKWYVKAAEQGFAMAQDNLGLLYRDGRGVARDDAAAVVWFRKAAEQGYSRAQDHLRFMHETRRGVANDDTCKLVQIDQWPVKFADNGWLVIDGAVNRQRVAIMLDTGAMRTVILRPLAARLGLKIDPLRGVRVVGPTGDSVAETAHVAELTIAGSTRRDWQMIVAGERDPGYGIGVILGEDFFQNVDVEFDLANRVIRLFQPRNCAGASLAYWTTDRAHEVAIEAVNSTRARIVIPVRVNGLPIVALFDTGANRSILHRHIAGRLGVRSNTPGVVAAGKFGGISQESSDLWIGPFESFEIGDEAIKGTSIPFGDIGAEHQMLLGLDFLLAHRLLVSHSQRKIYFTYAGGPVFKR